MSNTSTERMEMIAKDLEEEGLYTRANSVIDLARERDDLLKRVVKLQSELRIARWKLQSRDSLF